MGSIESRQWLRRAVLVAATLGATAVPALAGDLIYTPVNPGFGGSPINDDYLLGTANAQNKFIQQDSGSGGGSPNINFPPIDIDLGGLGNTPTIIVPIPQTPAATPTAGSSNP